MDGWTSGSFHILAITDIAAIKDILEKRKKKS